MTGIIIMEVNVEQIPPIFFVDICIDVNSYAMITCSKLHFWVLKTIGKCSATTSWPWDNKSCKKMKYFRNNLLKSHGILKRCIFLTPLEGGVWNPVHVATDGGKVLLKTSPFKIADFRGWQIHKYFLNYVSYRHDLKFHVNLINSVVWQNVLRVT